jgi:hypothetical protein
MKDYKDPMFIENDPMFVTAHVPWEIYNLYGSSGGVVSAKYPSVCKECGKKIAVGDDIRRSDKDDGWSHNVCQ